MLHSDIEVISFLGHVKTIKTICTKMYVFIIQGEFSDA